MIGIVIGTGEWSEIAHASAKRMHEMTGLRCEVIEKLKKTAPTSSWYKCFVTEHFPEEDCFMIFDADLLCLRPWDPQGLFERAKRPFMAVPDVRSNSVLEECNDLGIPFPDIMVNGGLTIFGREHLPVWKMTWEIGLGAYFKVGQWQEQGSLNLALLKSETEVCRLPRWFNLVTHKGELDKSTLHNEETKARVINLHACGFGGDAKGVMRIQRHYGLHDK